jgi:hypothetical protein
VHKAPGVVLPSLRPVKPPAPHWPEHPHEPASFGPVSKDFAGPADAGWQAAEALGDQAPDADHEQLTAAGLPKRRPRARLVPGSAETSTPAEPPRRPSRTAEQVRGRLARYQAGIRQGREDRNRHPDNPAQVIDEEHR